MINIAKHVNFISDLPRSFGEYITLLKSKKEIYDVPLGDGSPIIFLPGFTQTPLYLKTMMKYLKKINYKCYDWGLGRNLYLNEEITDQLLSYIKEISLKYNKKVTLIGHSLGGVQAKIAVEKNSNYIEKIITLGTPYSFEDDSCGHPIIVGMLKTINKERMDDQELMHLLLQKKPPVPIISIQSKTDGFITWDKTKIPDYENTGTIVIEGSHCGMPVNKDVFYQVANLMKFSHDFIKEK